MYWLNISCIHASNTDGDYIPNSTTKARPAPSIPAKAESLCERLGSVWSNDTSGLGLQVCSLIPLTYHHIS